MLSSVSLKRFKSIESTTIDLDRITVLVGPNNGGKSSFLQGLQFATSIIQSLHLEGVDKPASLQKNKMTGTLGFQQLIYSPLRDFDALASGGHLSQNKDKSIEITLKESGGELLNVSLIRGKNKNVSATISVNENSVIAESSLYEDMKNVGRPYSMISPGLAGIPNFEEFRPQGTVTRAAARGDANSVFRNVLWALKTNNRSNWDWFQDTLQSVFPDLVVDAEFNAETGENIVGTITRGSLKLPIDASGTGVLQMVQILAYIGLYEPRVLILDEPDSHLHPNNQRKLVSLLEKATQDKGFQVLISTHSRPFIDKLSSVGAKFVWVADGAVKSDNFDMIQAFSNLGALDVADYLDGGSTKKLILTEDTDVEYIRTIAVASGVSEDSTVIRSYNGVGNLNSAIELARFIKEQYRGTQVYIHRDRDRLNDKQVEEIKRKISGSGAVPFVTSGTDCEAYFVNPEHVSYVFPQISQNEAEDLVEEAIDLARSTSEAKLADDIFYDKMRIYNESGGKVERPKPSKITEEAKRLYGDNPARYMYGKKALGYLKNLIQERLTINNANGLVCPSKYVAVSEFRASPDSLHEG